MKTRISKIIALAALMLPAAAGMQAQDAGMSVEGSSYYLPQTALRFALQIEKSTYTPGEFAGYASRYLKRNDVSLSPSTTYRIVGLKLTSVAQPDTAKFFTAKADAKHSIRSLERDDNGVLVAVNAQPRKVEQPRPFRPAPKPAPLNPHDYMTEEILSAGSKAKMAELCVTEIYDIRENKGMLNKGQADFMPKDGEQLRLMLANLDTQEKALLELFTGTKTSERHTFVFDICPEQAAGQTTLFAFSKYLGMVDVDDPAGTPFVLNIQKLPSVKPVYVDNSGKQKKEVLDLRYVVPANVELSVTSGDEVWAKQVVPMAQFGQIEHLGGELFNKKFTTHVQLSPVTGGIVNIEAERPE